MAALNAMLGHRFQPVYDLMPSHSDIETESFGRFGIAGPGYLGLTLLLTSSPIR